MSHSDSNQNFCIVPPSLDHKGDDQKPKKEDAVDAFNVSYLTESKNEEYKNLEPHLNQEIEDNNVCPRPGAQVTLDDKENVYPVEVLEVSQIEDQEEKYDDMMSHPNTFSEAGIGVCPRTEKQHKIPEECKTKTKDNYITDEMENVGTVDLVNVTQIEEDHEEKYDECEIKTEDNYINDEMENLETDDLVNVSQIEENLKEKYDDMMSHPNTFSEAGIAVFSESEQRRKIPDECQAKTEDSGEDFLYEMC
ncbi:unnamed protein product [Ceutorhynchus assimilis]|uniref:Uncharacterized protein n=1 Tax=Ceutorhynchus assimilis TaxID=467358 RepID=A0A9N9MRB2_9CUCU|nr:unnamed protein product [Ceutorhynchus assimilis]